MDEVHDANNLKQDGHCTYTFRQLYKETDFILTKKEVLSMKQCMPSM